MNRARNHVPGWLTPVLAIIGPAVVMTAGIMGPGSTTSLVLAGAWFRYDLLWVAIIILPAVVVCLDSGARVGILSGGKGMLSVIRDEIHPVVTWFVLIIMVLFNLFVNMGMVSMLTAASMSVFGFYPPDSAAAASYKGYNTAQFILAIAYAGIVWTLLSTGSYKRVQRILTGLLFMVFVCYTIVAIRGFREIGSILAGLVPQIPPNLPIPGKDQVRETIASVSAIAGGALAPAPVLSFSYFTSDDKARIEDMPRLFWKSVLTLGCLFGAFSVLVLVAGGHALYPLENHAAIATVHEAGRVLTGALPAGLGWLGPKIFALGLFMCALNTFTVVTQLMCYFCLDAFGKDWHYTRENKNFKRLLACWIFVPAILSPLWQFPPLLKMVLLMGINIVLVPMAVLIVFYLINKRSLMKEHRANPGRNILLLASLTLSFWLVIVKAPGLFEQVKTALGR